MGVYGGSEECILPKMAKQLLRNDCLEVKDTFKDNFLEIGQISIKKNQFSAYKSDGIVVFVDGYVYNETELSGNNGDSFICTFRRLALEAYKNNALDSLLKAASGYFCGVVYDSVKKKVILFSDRLGTRFLYYYCKDGKLFFSSEVIGLLAIDSLDKTVSVESLECFINGGSNYFLLGDNTYFKSIKLLNPATILEYDIDSGQANQHYYWTFGEIKQVDMPYDLAVDRLHDLVENAVLRCVEKLAKDDFILPLSGGLDSRLIFAILNNHGKIPSFIYTNGDPNCTDVRYAKLLCKKFGYGHVVVKPNEAHDYIKNAMQSSMRCEGMCPFFEFGTFDVPANQVNKFAISGYVGDMVFGESFKKSTDFLDKRMDAKLAEHFYGKFYAQSNYDDSYADIQKIEASLFTNRVRRYTAHMLNIELHQHEPLLPYIDNDIIDFIYSLPDSYRFGNQLYADMCLKFYAPYFKSIPWNRTNLPIQGRLYRNTSSLLPRMMESIKGCKFISPKLKKSLLKRINYHTWFSQKTFHVFERELLKGKNAMVVLDVFNDSTINGLLSNESRLAVYDTIIHKDAFRTSLFLTTEFYFAGLKKMGLLPDSMINDCRSC